MYPQYPDNPVNPGLAGSAPYGAFPITIDFAELFRRVYLWLAVGLTISFGVAWAVGQYAIAQINAGQEPFIFNPIVWIGSIILYLVMGFAFYPLVRRVSPVVGGLLFILMAAALGLMVASIFVAYTSSSIAAAFFITATMFALTTLIGFTTKLDLSKFRGLLVMALIGFFVALIVNVFLHSSLLFWIVSIVGVVLFSALTAYDTQWIKRNAAALAGTSGAAQEASLNRIALIGAFRLFLDFINLFLSVLELTGGRSISR